MNSNNKTEAEANFLELLLDWSHGGIDFSEPGNGGVECRDHVPVDRRLWETVIGVATPGILLLTASILKSKSTSSNNQCNNNSNSRNYSLLRLFLLVSLSFTFGIEVGYKFATKQLIFLLNPCHVTSLVQIYLLAMPSDYFGWHDGLYKTMLHFLHGPMAAILFPVTEALKLPFEKEIYWIQHVLIVLVPLYFILVNDGHGYKAHK